MASNVMRLKWMLVKNFSKQKAEVLALVFILGMLSIIVSFAWEASQPNDGTFIDLSEQHQVELIERFKVEQAMLEKLRHHQNVLDKAEGVTNSQARNILHGRVRDSKDKESPSDKVNMTKLKENPSFGIRDPVVPKDFIAKKQPDKKVEIQTGHENTEKKQKYVKFYDPSQGKIIYKPVIEEESELHGGTGQCRIYDITEKLLENYDCMTLSVRPITPICLYPDKEDIHISRHIREEGIWEPHIVRDYQNILYGDQEMAVIDIGANIGVYTLLAAAMGHQVLAVEPFENNIKRIQKAAQMGNLTDKITVLQNGVSDKRSKLFLKLDDTNQGGVSLQLENPHPDCIEEECRAPTVNTVYMDDLLEIISFKKAIMKIDIEGHEHRAFLHSEKFLDKIYVPYIFMEWMKLRNYYGAEITQSEDKDLTQRLVNFLVKKGYSAFSSVTMEKLNTDWWVGWTDDIIWKHELHDFHKL